MRNSNNFLQTNHKKTNCICMYVSLNAFNKHSMCFPINGTEQNIWNVLWDKLIPFPSLHFTSHASYFASLLLFLFAEYLNPDFFFLSFFQLFI